MSDPQQPSAAPHGQPYANPQPPHDPRVPPPPAAPPIAETPWPASAPPFAPPQGYSIDPQGTYGVSAAPPHAPSAPPSQTGPGLGRAAFIVALIVLLADLSITLAYPLIYLLSDGSYVFSAISGALTIAANVIVFLGSALALVLGIVAVRRPSHRVLPGIAIGIAATGLIGPPLSWIADFFYAL